MAYIFMSFGSHHTAKNIGCCIVKTEGTEDANEKCKRLGLMPNECNQARGYELTEESFVEQDMELNKFYTVNEMEKMGFEKG